MNQRQKRHTLPGTGVWSPRDLWSAVLVGALLAGAGCGLQDSFRRPKKDKRESSGNWRRLLRPGSSSSGTGYVRAYSSWFADHASLVERIRGNPAIVRDIYSRLREHLEVMRRYMFLKEREVFDRDVVDAYDSLMARWPTGASTVAVERRLSTLNTRVRRSYAPGKFPFRRTGEALEIED